MITLKPDDPFVAVKREIINNLTIVIEPDLPVNIFNLGMVYEIDIAEKAGNIEVTVALSPSNRRYEEAIVNSVTHSAVLHLANYNLVVNLVWTPNELNHTSVGNTKKQFA